MTTNIRNNVFETNSSSSHSIHISEEVELLDTSLTPNHEGTVILEGGQFGWGFDKFEDASTKANYLSIQDSGVDRELLVQAIKEQTSAKEVKFFGVDDYDSQYWSYIDHQSSGTASELDTVEKIKNFIFNLKCVLYIDNDNH